MINFTDVIENARNFAKDGGLTSDQTTNLTKIIDDICVSFDESLSTIQSNRNEFIKEKVFTYNTDNGNIDTAKIYCFGCGFAFHMVMELFDGEQVVTMSESGGHFPHGSISNVECDDEIKTHSYCGFNEDTENKSKPYEERSKAIKEANKIKQDNLSKILKSWLSKDLVRQLEEAKMI